MTGDQLPRASSGQTLVIDGDLWNRLMDRIERNGRMYACPPLMLSDNGGGKVLSLVQTPSGSSLARVIATSAGTVSGVTLKCKTVTKDTTTGVGSEFDVQLCQGHAIGDVFYAIKSQNGTDNVGVDWIEHLTLTPNTNRYRIVQVMDTTGRIGIDSARFE